MTATARRRNPKLSASEMLAVRARMREPESYAQELTLLQLCGHYPDDQSSASLYRAAAEKWKEVPVLRLVTEPGPQDFAQEASAQVGEARARLDLDLSAAPRMPWPVLHKAIGHGLLPEQLWVATADSGQGKTTWLSSVVDQWLLERRRIFLLPLEQGVDTTRIYLAALATGLPVKSVLKNAWDELPPGAKKLIEEHLDWQEHEGAGLLHLHRDGRVDVKDIPTLYRQAADFGAELVGIDHIHRVRARSYGEYEDLCALLPELAKQYKIPCLATAQNHRGQGPQDRVRAHMIPTVDRIQGGKVLEQNASVVLGIYRPLRDDIDDETLAAIRRGQEKILPWLKPFTVGVAGLKARIEGEVGWVVDLQWEKGRIIDPEHEAQKRTEAHYDI